MLVKMSVATVLLSQASELITLRALPVVENTTWSKTEPMAELKVVIENPEGQGQFTPGDSVSVNLLREGEVNPVLAPQPVPVPMPESLPFNSEGVLKRLDTLEQSVNVIQVAGEKLRSYYDSGRIAVPNGADVNDFIAFTSATTNNAKEIRASMQYVREALNDAGLI